MKDNTMNNVAKTILAQLGGNRFSAMTGVKTYLYSENSLSFQLPRIAQGISNVEIVLDVNDTYNVTFTKWNARKFDFTIVSRHTNITCDMLQNLFTNETGLACHL